MAATLLVPKEQIEKQIADAIAAAENLVRPGDDRRVAQAAYETWDKRNELVLESAFEVSGFLALSPKDDYLSFVGLEVPFGLAVAKDATVEQIASDVAVKRNRLKVILATIDAYPAASGTAQDVDSGPEKPFTHIFIVHGRDEAARLHVDRLIRRGTPCTPVVLAEQTGGGATIIEKIESHLTTDRVGMAVILMTADDEGNLRGEHERRLPRARQNVVLELGYAMAALGRRRVVVLHEEGVELPSDVHGVAYYGLDAGGAWQARLLGEFRSAGIDVNPDVLVDPNS